ncbi:hypothetical protein [Croceivirga radicis]|uniref:hypothetical protein n=1 Tax=Croceivirga radicis TaxID=1929488 RepID=UPI000255ABEB|nr:hypothetical protein [Croceivirga radicis]
MQRKIVSYKNLDHKTASLLLDKYPHGYGDEDIYTLKKPNGEIIEAVEIKTEDTIYLVKISNSLTAFIENFDRVIEAELNKELGQVDLPLTD